MKRDICKKCFIEHKYSIVKLDKEMFCKNCPSCSDNYYCNEYKKKLSKISYIDEKCKFVLEHQITINEEQLEKAIDEIFSLENRLSYKFCICKFAYLKDVPEECFFKEEQNE